LKTNNFDALNLAIWCGCYEMVDYLLNENKFYDEFILNKEFQLKNEKFTSLKLNIFLAAECCHVKIMKLFLDKGIEIHVRNENNLTPLHVTPLCIVFFIGSAHSTAPIVFFFAFQVKIKF
jgi:hypothetical protein